MAIKEMVEKIIDLGGLRLRISLTELQITSLFYRWGN